MTKLWFKVASKQSWHQALEFKWVCWGKRVQTIKVWQKLHKWKPLMLHLLWWKTQPKIILTPTTFGLWPLTDSKTKERKNARKTWPGMEESALAPHTHASVTLWQDGYFHIYHFTGKSRQIWQSALVICGMKKKGRKVIKLFYFYYLYFICKNTFSFFFNKLSIPAVTNYLHGFGAFFMSDTATSGSGCCCWGDSVCCAK